MSIKVTPQLQEWKYMTREDRAKELLKSCSPIETSLGWEVPSQTDSKNNYLVEYNDHEPKCNCLDCKHRQSKCKHIFAVELYIRRQIDEKGRLTETKEVKVTYEQNWSAYNKAQTNEKLIFMKLLKDLCANAEQPEYKFGRPALPFSDMLFGSVMKVYTGFSLRRFMSDMKIAKEMGLVDIVPSYSTISNFMNRGEIKVILDTLIKTSASPLREVETAFAIDSLGFSTSRFARWFDYKWGKEKKHKVWMKAHINSGVKTNIITAVNITEGTSSDSNELKSLIEQTAENFNMSEVSADKAYTSKKNLELIKEHGAIPFIPFKKNVTGKARGSMVWKKMYHYFMYKNDEFMKHYNKRSNVETCFHMIKSKFGDSVRSKKKTSQVNELLIKVLCHNICVVIQEVCELGIKAEFSLEVTKDCV